MSNKEEIEQKYPSICYGCDWARDISESNLEKGYVGCALRLVGRGNGHYDCDEITDGEVIAEGWIYNKRRPFDKDKHYLSGVMTNYQLITKGINNCRQYEPRTD